MRRGTVLVVAAVVAVLLLVGGVALGMVLGGDDPETPASPGPTQQPAPTQAPPESSDDEAGDLGVAAGEGGTALAPDGVTPVGFEPTCAGAVQAAAVYDVALQNNTTAEGVGTEDAVAPEPREGLAETLDMILIGNDPSHENTRKRAFPNAIAPGYETDNAQGGYLVVDCQPREEAVISLFGCFKMVGPLPDELAAQGTSGCGTSTYTLVWSTDWKVAASTSGAAERGGPQPEDGAEYEGFGWPWPLPAEERQALLSAMPGWQEFTNAP